MIEQREGAPAPLIRTMAGGIHWEVNSDFFPDLFGEDGPPLDCWLRDGRAQVVKHGPHRTVYRVDLPGVRFHLKHYRLANTRAWLRQLVRPSQARVEFHRALRIAARGVPTIMPLALGERWRGPRPRENFLLSQSLEDTEPLNQFIETTLPQMPAHEQPQVRRRLAVALAELLARMHDHGVLHHDLHPGNLLIRQNGSSIELFVIDLFAVRLKRTLSWETARDNLVVLNRWFVLRSDRADRLRFWRTYWRLRRERLPDVDDVRVAALDLERRTWASNLTFWKHRDRRCLFSNRYFRRVRSAAAVGHAVSDFDSATMNSLFADPDELFRRPGVKLLKDSRSATVAELSLGGRRVIYKRFRTISTLDPWLALVRRSKALRSWVSGQGLRERCLPTPRPLAVLHRRHNGLWQDGYLLMEKIEGARDLHAFLRETATRCEKWRCIDQVARLVRELHRRQLSHRDLKAANVLLTDSACWLIDLVGVVRYERLRRPRRLQNLTRLHASFHQSEVLSRSDKLRFLRVYQEWGLLGNTSWKRWWRAIERRTKAKVLRNEKNGRPLA
jgi:tRNA A-37 threonylcarbamoyl transferase component Bud32